MAYGPNDEPAGPDDAEREKEERRQLDGERQAPEVEIGTRSATHLVVGDLAQGEVAGIDEELDELHRNEAEAERRCLSDFGARHVAGLIVEAVLVQEEQVSLAGACVHDHGRGDERSDSGQDATEAPRSRRGQAQRRKPDRGYPPGEHQRDELEAPRCREEREEHSRERGIEDRRPDRCEPDDEDHHPEKRCEEVAPGDVRPVPRPCREDECNEARAARRAKRSAGRAGGASRRREREASLLQRRARRTRESARSASPRGSGGRSRE